MKTFSFLKSFFFFHHANSAPIVENNEINVRIMSAKSLKNTKIVFCKKAVLKIFGKVTRKHP